VNKKRSYTIYSRSAGSEIAQGVEVSEWEKRKDKVLGRVSLRFFISDNSREVVRFVADPMEAYDLYLKINKVARSTGACREQSLTHKAIKDDSGRKSEMITSVAVEKWMRNGRTGYAISGHRTIQGRSNTFDVSITDVARLLHLGEFMRFLSCSQCWESILD
jgi:hypothetical protein